MESWRPGRKVFEGPGSRSPILHVVLLVFACGVIETLTQTPPRGSGVPSASLDPSIRPQDDLFHHANAQWQRAVPLPDDRVSYSASVELVDLVEHRIRAIVDDLVAQPASRRGPEARQIVDLYRSIADPAPVERLGLAPVRADLDRIHGIEDAGDLAAVAGYLSSVAAGGPFEAVVGMTEGVAPAPVVRVEPGGTLLPDRAYYLSAEPAMVEIRADYARYLARLFVAAGAHDADAAIDARAVVDLEIRLAAAQWPGAGSPASGGQPLAVTVSRLDRDFPGFDWRAWARPQGLDRAASLVLAQPSFFRAFAKTMAATPIRTTRAWLLGRFLTAMASYLPRAFADARFEFFGTRLTGQVAPRPHWKRGVSLVSEFLGDAVGRRYVARHFPASSRARVEAIVSQVLAASREAVRDAAWMPPATKTASVRRLSTIATRIGYPERWREYSGFEVRPDDLVGNIRRARAFENQNQMARHRESRDPRGWLITAQTVNAYYSPAPHEVVLPAGILQPPYFDPDADEAVNFGAIGAVVGHEVGHVIDVTAFQGAAATLVRQFNAFEALPGVPVNGALTLAENLSDLSGLAIAHLAYRRSLQGRQAPVVDGLTGDQRFFLGWARMWRSQSRAAFVRYTIGTSPHAPPQFRANGPLSHVDAFYEAFGVVPGDRLYRAPDDRVRLWGRPARVTQSPTPSVVTTGVTVHDRVR